MVMVTEYKICKQSMASWQSIKIGTCQVVDGVGVAGEVCAVQPELAPVEHVEAAVAAAGHQLGVVVHHAQAVHLALVHLRLRVRLLPADVEALDRA